MSTTTNSAPDAQPIHQPFTWVPNVESDDRNAHFAALTLDVCNGLRTCLQLVHANIMADSTCGDVQPLLGFNDKENLVLFAAAAVQMLGERAFERADYLNDQARKATAPKGAAR